MISRENLKAIPIVLIVFAVLAIVIALGRQQVSYREKHPVYTLGKVLDISKEARGEEYVNYSFRVDTVTYKGRVPVKFCLECRDSCCRVGGIVKVRYAEGDPANNDLVH